MRTFYLKNLLCASLIFGLNYDSSAQSLSLDNTGTNTTATGFLVAPVGANTISIDVQRDGFNTGGTPNWQWTVSPATGASFGGSSGDAERILTFNNTANPGTTPIVYTVTVSRSGTSTQSASTTVTLYPSNMWAASNGGDDVVAFSIANGVFTAGPTYLFDPQVGNLGTAAIGRSPYPTPANGYFYYMPNNWPNTGTVSVYGKSGNGTGSNTLIGTLDLNGTSSNSLGFVRLGMDSTVTGSTGWMLAGDGTDLILAKFISNNLNPAPITIVDPSVTITGGSVSTFQNGDICLDKAGNIFALANNTGTTQIYIGQPNGANTVLNKEWDILDNNGNPFGGTVNGAAFDTYGGLYLSTNTGIYYLDPVTVQSATGTVQASLVYSGGDFTDLGTNVFPNTVLPVVFGDFSLTKQSENLLLQWNTYSEENAKSFEIQKSVNGDAFTTIGSVLAKGNSSQLNKYQYKDYGITPNEKTFYRIKNLDINGRFTYSKILTYQDIKNNVSDINLFPNPAKDQMSLQINLSQDEKLFCRIIDIKGQAIKSFMQDLSKGNQVLDLSNQINDLVTGQYILEIASTNTVKTMKFSKL